jgi:hypothetical protein
MKSSGKSFVATIDFLKRICNLLKLNKLAKVTNAVTSYVNNSFSSECMDSLVRGSLILNGLDKEYFQCMTSRKQAGNFRLRTSTGNAAVLLLLIDQIWNACSRWTH